MAIDLRLLIESEFDIFKDPSAKRGPRHRSQKIGLNLNRKHQNVIAAWNKSDPNQIGALEKLRGMNTGRGFVTFQEGEQLKQKYGLNTDDGYLGTTGIRLIRTLKGYDLVKEATIVFDGEKWPICTPDDIFDSSAKGETFSLYDGTFLYGTWYHYEFLEELLKPTPGPALKFYPHVPNKLWFEKVRTNWKIFYDQWRKTATPSDLQDWGVYGNARQFFHLSGRAGLPKCKPNMISFWNPMQQVNMYTAKLSPFIKDVLKLNKPLIITPDNKNGTYLGGTASNAIDKEILTKQHVAPELKKAALFGGGKRRRMLVGSTRLGDVAQKAGYQSSAEYKAANVIGDSVLKETPELVDGKFNRDDYKGYLFVGNKTGTGMIYGDTKEYVAHSNLMRSFVRGEGSDNIMILGTISPKDFAGLNISMNDSGVILPLQEGLDGTYISIWNDKYQHLKLMLNQLIKAIGAKGPFYVELTDTDSMTHMSTGEYV